MVYPQFEHSLGSSRYFFPQFTHLQFEEIPGMCLSHSTAIFRMSYWIVPLMSKPHDDIVLAPPEFPNQS